VASICPVCLEPLPWKHWRVIAEHAACEALEVPPRGDGAEVLRHDPVRLVAMRVGGRDVLKGLAVGLTRV
jgi:hypothetical protein